MAMSVIIVCIGAACPLLVFPFAIFQYLADKHRWTPGGCMSALYLICLVIAAFLSPIFVIRLTLDKGLLEGMNELGMVYGITIAEIHLTFWLLFRTSKVRKLFHLPPIQKHPGRKTFMEQEGGSGTGVACVCILAGIGIWFMWSHEHHYGWSSMISTLLFIYGYVVLFIQRHDPDGENNAQNTVTKKENDTV